MSFAKNNFLQLVYFCILHLICFIEQGESIFNGTRISVRRAPHHVSIIRHCEDCAMIYTCGGSIISESWILTAAHCFKARTKSQEMVVQTGLSTRDYADLRSNVEKVIVHGDYTPDTAFADIALVKLKAHIEFNEYQQPIAIASRLPKIGEKMFISGMGVESEILDEADSLKLANLEMMSHKECTKLGATKSHFCSSDATTDSCRGDSGSAVVYRKKLVGIASYGPECLSEDKKDEDMKAAAKAYTRVDVFYHWIIDTTGIVY